MAKSARYHTQAERTEAKELTIRLYQQGKLSFGKA